MTDLLSMTPIEFCVATDTCIKKRELTLGEFVLTQPTMADVWDNCPRTDWLRWITDKLGQHLDDRTLLLHAVWCARNTPLSDGRKTSDLLIDQRSIAAIEIAERFAYGQATAEELAAAKNAADAAWAHLARHATSAVGYAAGWAAFAARNTAWTHPAREAAWGAEWGAFAAAYSAEYDAREPAVYVAESVWYVAESARAAAQKAQAEHFRTLVPNPFRKETQS